MSKLNKLIVDPFCKRQFVKNTSSYIDYPIQQFQKQANKHWQNKETKLLDGYAPFCKHIFIQNFVKMPLSAQEITPQNQHLLRTVYEARTQKELPVLKRYFPRESIPAREAKYLDLILYSKQQIQKENQAMGQTDPNAHIQYDYGIISVKPSDVPYETPMDPITMMRNALGKEHGGSGVGLDKTKYMESVQYWSRHALTK